MYISMHNWMNYCYYCFEQAIISDQLRIRKLHVFILPSLTPSLMFSFSLCRSEFLTCIIFLFFEELLLIFLVRLLATHFFMVCFSVSVFIFSSLWKANFAGNCCRSIVFLLTAENCSPHYSYLCGFWRGGQFILTLVPL